MAAWSKAFLAVALFVALNVGSPAFAAPFSESALASSGVEPQPPSIVFGELFRDVQLAQIFPDQKTFCDLIPTEPPARIRAEYAAQKGQPGFSLARFVAARFSAFATCAGACRRARASLHRRLMERPRGKHRNGQPGCVAHTVAAAVRRSRRTLSRNVLLGQFLHDARPRGRRP